MKAYLIDPFTKTVTEVEHNGDFREIYKFIEAESFDVVMIKDRHTRHPLVIYVDEDGLFKPLQKQAYFQIGSHPIPLAGKALVLGNNSHGESVDVPVPLDRVVQAVKWVDQEEVRRLSNAGVFDTQVYSLGDQHHATIPVRIPEENDE